MSLSTYGASSEPMAPENQDTSYIPYVPWDKFAANFVWKQGEHVALIGPTGSGKTTLLLALIAFRKYVVVIGTKPADRTLAQLQRRGFKRIEKWNPRLSPRAYPKRLLWPDASEVDSEAEQRKEILAALKAIYKQKGWCVCIDELWYVIHHLKLEKTVKTYLQQARAINISLICATQRPAFVPLEVYDQSTHLFFWRDNDERNLSRISGISWLSAKVVKNSVARLPLHDVLYINTREGTLIQTTPPAPAKG